jgi:hypothetical protein
VPVSTYFDASMRGTEGDVWGSRVSKELYPGARGAGVSLSCQSIRSCRYLLADLLTFTEGLTDRAYHQLIPNLDLDLPSMQIPLPTMFLTTITNMNSIYIIPSYNLQIGKQCCSARGGGKVELINVDMTQIEADLQSGSTSGDQVSKIKEGTA